jgi:predicted nucleotidyltransferase
MVGERGKTMKSENMLDALTAEFESIKSQIIQKIDPDKILLFGSLAKKNVSLTSDIDIIIIKETERSFKERMNELYSIIDYRYPTDMFYYTPDEIQRLKEKNYFIKHALSEGIWIYEKE